MPLKLGKWEAKILLEAMAATEEYKPIQVAKRMVMLKYGLAGTSKDRVFTALIYWTWRTQGIVDRVAASRLRLDSLHPIVRAAVRLYTYQLLFAHKEHPDMTRWMERYFPRVVAELLGEDHAKLLEKYMAGLKAKPPKVDPVEERYHVSRFLFDKVASYFGRREAEELFSFLYHWTPPLSFRVNTLKATVEEVLEELRSLGARAWRSSRHPQVVFAERGFDLRKFRALEDGRVIPQDESSAFAATILSPEPGDRVVDLCAAPGGKTTHLAEIAGNKATIVAFDIYPDRVAKLRENLVKTSTYVQAHVVMSDARLAPQILGEEWADKVLVDPPCSSTGTIAKSPDVRWRLTPSDLEELVKLQEQILEAGVRLLKPGGRLLYTTCSVLPEEGELLVKRILGRHPELKIVPLRGPYEESKLLPGTMRAWPHKHRTTGFYYALLEKVG